MSYVSIDDFKLGMDTRKPRVSGVPGSLIELKNGHITRGAHITRMKKFVSTYALPAAKTFGFHGQGQNLFVFGGLAEPVGLPAGTTYQRLQHKTTPTTEIAKILDTENFDGKIYAIAEFTDGNVYHYYDGARVTDWDDLASAISNNDTVAAALSTRIDLDPMFDSSVAGSVVTITAATAGVPFTIDATAQNFGTVDDQLITLAEVTPNNSGIAEVKAAGSLTVTGGSAGTVFTGSVTLASGASGSVDTITVNGVDILGASVPFNTSLTQTAADVAAQCTTFSSSPDYTVTSSGAVVTIKSLITAAPSPNGFVVDGTSTTITLGSKVNLTGGVYNALTALTVDGVSIINSEVAFNSDDAQTAADIATSINAKTSSPNYTALATGTVVAISAVAGSGSTPNGFVVSRSVVGDMTAGTANMAGGSAATGQVKQQWTATVSGTFEAVDVFTITLNGEGFTVTGNATGTGTTAVTWKKKVYVTTLSLLFFCGLNNPTVWVQVPDPAVASQTGAGFINFSSQDSGSEVLTGTGVYQGNIAVFSEAVSQIEFVDVDETANAHLHTVKNTGTRAHKSVVQFGNNDLFYLDEVSGVRSLRARDSSNAPETDDVGTPIDSHILAYLETITDQQVIDSVGLIAEEGRYWLAINERIYVYTFFKNSKISAWSFYEPGLGQIDEMVRIRKNIYVRAGDTIYQYGGSAGTTYPGAAETPISVKLPFMDLGKAGHEKTLDGFGMGALNEWDIEVLPDPDDETKKGAQFTVSGTTYPDDKVGGQSMRTTHFAMDLSCSAAGNAELYNLVSFYTLDETD